MKKVELLAPAGNYESFLGANSPRGFVSLFEELYNPYLDCRAFVIKGGPGTGKSTLIRCINLLDNCK